ncbi:hypothetical protein CP8484711_0512A, partial [Chlamydia psittaci 84-8471/1]
MASLFAGVQDSTALVDE